jgi:hypothetical protein
MTELARTHTHTLRQVIFPFSFIFIIMNTFDSQHSSSDYGEDLLESNPFADTPSHSTHDLNTTSTTVEEPSSSHSVEQPPPTFQADNEEEEEQEYINEGKQVSSHIHEQLEELSLDSSAAAAAAREEEQAESIVETDTQVGSKFFIFLAIFNIL